MQRVNISVNAPNAPTAESMVRRQMDRDHLPGKVVGSALSSNQRDNEHVALYAVNTLGNLGNFTWVVYVERPGR